MSTKDQKIAITLFCFFLLAGIQPAESQIWKRVKNRVKQTVEDRTVNKSGDATNQALDQIGQAGKTPANSTAASGENTESGRSKKTVEIKDYKNYDFVPGDKIIFQPDLSGEADEELPARFTVNYGNAEIQTFEGEKVLHLDKGSDAVVSPLIVSDSYLPEQFTIELDMMYENDADKFTFNTFSIQLRKPGYKNFSATPPHNLLIVANDQYEWGDVNASRNDMPDALKKSMLTNNTWHHIAIYVRKNIGKGYIDQYRVAASNTMPTGLGFVDIKTNGNYGMKIKNMRIAAGGSDKYNKIVTDGKFITHGILFDVNKSTIKPESMGTLNEIAKMMKDHADLRFEIDGHTDSDGADDVNMKLSQARAGAVKDKLTSMGINAERLTAKGFGETKPIDKNDNAEGKANNRRVEFVKI